MEKSYVSNRDNGKILGLQQGQFVGSSTGTIPMIKSLVVAAALTIGLAGYAVAQNTITGAPAGTAPETPAPGTPLPIPGVTPAAPTRSHSGHVRRKGHTSAERARASAHHMHNMR